MIKKFKIFIHIHPHESNLDVENDSAKLSGERHRLLSKQNDDDDDDSSNYRTIKVRSTFIYF